MPNVLTGVLSGSSSIIRTQPLTATVNGTYNPPSGIDGYKPVTVNVSQHEPVIEQLTALYNGTYNAPSGVDGYDPVVVNVPQQAPILDDITITANGHYVPPEGIDGYDDITVNVVNEIIKYLDNKLVGSSNPQYFTVNLDVNLISNKWYILALNDSYNSNSILYTLFKFDGSSVNVQISGGGETYQATISGSQFSLIYWTGDWRNVYATITEASDDQFYLPS